MLRIAVCDENKNVINAIRKIVEEHFSGKYVLWEHSSAASLLEQLGNFSDVDLDVLILDVRLGSANGIEIAKRLHHGSPAVKIIFSASQLQYLKDIFEADPIYLLVKPISAEKVVLAVKKAMALLQQEYTQVLSFQNGSGVHNVPIDTIHYIENCNKTVKIHQPHEVVVQTSAKLCDIIQRLPAHFLRCHYSYIVNMDCIESFTTTGILLYTGEHIPVSRSQYHAAKESFLCYLGKTL